MDAYSKLPKLYEMENTTTEEVTDKLDTFQSRFGKLDEFGWWDLGRTQTDAGSQFISKDSQEGLSVHGVRLTLEASDHQEMDDQVEFTWRTLKTIAHSIMLHAQVSDEYIHFALMYTTYDIFTVLPIKHLVNQDGGTTTPHKLATGMKPSVSNLQYQTYVIYFVHVL